MNQPPLLQTIRFHNTAAFSGLTGVVNHEEAMINGVSLITGDVVAEGHDLKVDDTTLTQLHELAKKMGQVPVGLDHGSGITSINGYLDNFRVDGNQLRGDWHLLKTHDETLTMLERAERQPKTFGLSVAFKGKGVAQKGGGKSARAEKLLSADVVTRPAANPEGLFSARDGDSVDTAKLVAAQKATNPDHMANQNSQTAEPTIADVLAAINAQNARIDQIAQVQDQLVGHINSGVDDDAGIDPDFLNALNEATPEELAAYNEQNGTNITRADINGAIDQYNASIGGEQGQEGEGADQNGITADGSQNAEGPLHASGSNGNGVEGGAATGTAVALNALRKEVIELKAERNREKQLQRTKEEEIQFAAMDANMTALAAQRDRAIELAERVIAENEALQLCVRTGTRPVKAGIDNGVRLFSANDSGELHQFQQMVKTHKETAKCSEGQAIMFCSKEAPALHADWVQSQNRK